MKPIARYGVTFPAMISHGRSGETSSASIVPVSFSRVSEMAVISDEMIVRTNAMRPGTNRFELSRVGLKRMRLWGTMRIDLAGPKGPALPDSLAGPKGPALPDSPDSPAHWFTTDSA